MTVNEPNFNIVTPQNIKHVLAHQEKAFSKRLSQLLDRGRITSIRIMISDLRKDEIIEIIDFVRVMSNNKVPILIENNLELVAEIKADGVHLTSGQKLVKTAKSLLGEYQVLGVFCGLSKHSGIVAAEQGANYISFKADYDLIKHSKSTIDLYKWWSEAIEIPLMGECSEDCLISADIWNYCDFLSLRENIWRPEISINSLFQPHRM